MNSMKKMSAALLAALMLTGACAQAETVTGTATGMGAVSVELTVEDGKITAATVDTSHETVGIGQELGEQFAAQIVEKQGEFDAVSGATITSTAVKTALSSAMQQAGLAEAASVSMTPGVYVGTARGSRSDIKMAVEVDETTIKNIWNVENGDSPVFSQMAIDAMADEIVDAQSLAVDTYTGATISSRGAIMAVENALRQAGADTTAFYANGVEHALTPGEDIDVDVLVVGGGTSGLVAALAVVNFLRIIIFTNTSMMIAAVVSVTLFCTVIIAMIVGCLLPIGAKKIGFDPAVMASPMITTIVDACSLMIYFLIASTMLGL